MSAASGQSERGPVSPGLAIVFATTGYVALVVFGLGMASLATGEAVVETPGLGQAPGIVGVVLSAVVLAASLWRTVRRRHPSFWNSAWMTAATFLAYLAGLWIAAVAGGTDAAAATAVAGRIATTWFGAVIAGSALIAAWSAVALVRTRARRPRWPWEEDDE